LPGRFGDPGDGYLPGAAASATSATTGARARLLSGNEGKETPARACARAGFLLSGSDQAALNPRLVLA